MSRLSRKLDAITDADMNVAVTVFRAQSGADFNPDTETLETAVPLLLSAVTPAMAGQAMDTFAHPLTHRALVGDGGEDIRIGYWLRVTQSRDSYQRWHTLPTDEQRVFLVLSRQESSSLHDLKRPFVLHLWERTGNRG